MEQVLNTLMKHLGLMPAFFGTLLAVVVGAMLAWVPLGWQLKHDSKERERERQMSLRRDVYLSAAEKIGEALEYLMCFFQTEKVPPKGLGGVINQIRIIGSDETIAAINQFNDYLVNAHLELGPQKNEIDILENRNKFLSVIIKSGIDLDKNIRELEDAWKEGIKLTYKLAEQCQQKAQAAEELFTPIIVAIRKEMGAPFDDVAYRAMMKISNNDWKKATEKYVIAMRERGEQAIQTIIKGTDL